MNADTTDVMALERKFWQSMLDEDTDAALALLTEPAFMVSPHGTLKFDHAGYRQMAEQGSMVIKRYELGDIDASFVGNDVAVLSYEVNQVIAPRGDPSRETQQHMKDTSTWVRAGGTWRCAMHTETPMK
jgi:ketosteroid isomerase-like protein